MQKFVFYGFQMDQGEVLLYKFEKLNLTVVLRMIDDEQVDCVVCGMRRYEKNTVKTKLTEWEYQKTTWRGKATTNKNPTLYNDLC